MNVTAFVFPVVHVGRPSACSYPRAYVASRPRRPRRYCARRQSPTCIESHGESSLEVGQGEIFSDSNTPRGGFGLAELPMVVLDAAPARPGAYAVRDVEGILRYIGYSKDISKKLRFHLDAVGPERAASCQVYAPQHDKITPDLLEAVLEYWVRENGGIVPSGNMEDRWIWEGNSSANASFSTEQSLDDRSMRHQSPSNRAKAAASIPYRARQSAKRVVDMRGSNSAASFSQSSRTDPDPSENDYVRVDIDPLDPFSPGRRPNSPQWSSSSFGGDSGTSDDWLPLLAVVGIATFMWICGVLGNALPAATPTLGM